MDKAEFIMYKLAQQRPQPQPRLGDFGPPDGSSANHYPQQQPQSNLRPLTEQGAPYKVGGIDNNKQPKLRSLTEQGAPYKVGGHK